MDEPEKIFCGLTYSHSDEVVTGRGLLRGGDRWRRDHYGKPNHAGDYVTNYTWLGKLPARRPTKHVRHRLGIRAFGE